MVFSIESCVLMLNESLDRYLQLRIASFFKLFRSTVLYHAEANE